MRTVLFLLCLSLLFCSSSNAQFGGGTNQYELYVLIKSSGSSPTPDAVVNGVNSGLPVLTSLVGNVPDSAEFMVRDRLAGAAQQRAVASPDSPMAKLQRYVRLRFKSKKTISQTIADLQVDPYVETVTMPVFAQIFSASSVPNDPWFQGQWALEHQNLGVESAWDHSYGRSVVSVLDVGVDTDHPDLRSFTGNQYIGGAFREHTFRDFGNPASGFCGTSQDVDINVDTLEPEARADLNCNIATGATIVIVEPNVCLTMADAGHGTHVSGIVAATTDNGIGVSGVCRDCSLNVNKVSAVTGVVGDVGTTGMYSQAVVEGMAWAISNGTEIISKSFGILPDDGNGNCDFLSDDLSCDGGLEGFESWCMALALAEKRDVIVLSAAGNRGASADTFNLPGFDDFVAWPAKEPSVWAIGGIDDQLFIWDEKDSNGVSFPEGWFESGSNFGSSIDFMAPARHIYSTVYPGQTWISNGLPAPTQPCGDQAPDGDPSADGYGECTGTSMSTPFMAGATAILRGANPLLLKGDLYAAFANSAIPVNNCPGPGSGIYCGNGIPQVDVAVSEVLGTVNGIVVNNRLTPVFSVRSTDNVDYFQSTSPQSVLTTVLDQSVGYNSAPGAGGITAYSGYLLGTGDGALPEVPAPVAEFYLFTTRNSPIPTHDIVPLYRLARERANGPVDYRYATDVSVMEGYVNAGWNLDRIEGYVFENCTGCSAPSGTVAIQQKRRSSTEDHGVFISTTAISGYSNFGPVLGYAYENIDADSDGLIDGLESILGLDDNNTDSDCDGVDDNVEFPLAGLPLSDPLDGGCSVNLSHSVTTSTNYFTMVVDNNGSDDLVAGNVVLDITTQGIIYSVDGVTQNGCTLVDIGSQCPNNMCPRQLTCPVGGLNSGGQWTAGFSIQSGDSGALQFSSIVNVNAPQIDPNLTDNSVSGSISFVPSGPGQ